MDRRDFLARASGASLACLTGSQSGSLPNFDRRRERGRSTDFEKDDAWERIRQQFLMADDLVYLNSGGLGPTPTSVLKVMADTLCELQVRTNHGHNLIEDARPIVADFVGCGANELAFTRNATEGNSTVASGLRLSPGDEVIFDSHAHQGGSLVWLTRQSYDGIVVKIFDPDPVSLQSNVDRIQNLITPRTKVIQVSHVTAPTGIRMPVEAIGHLARAHGIWFHIDAAQSLGMFPFRINELNCDSLAACCHKWMCGPLGTGILFVRHDRLDDLKPTDVGSYAEADWDLPATLQLTDSACRFECGTRDCETIVGIVETLRLLVRLEMAKIAEHGRGLARHLRQRLVDIKKVDVISPKLDELSSLMVAFTVDGQTCDQVFSQLLQLGFRCRPVRERKLNAVRVSTHFFNTRVECDRLIEAIDRLA